MLATYIDTKSLARECYVSNLRLSCLELMRDKSDGQFGLEKKNEIYGIIRCFWALHVYSRNAFGDIWIFGTSFRNNPKII